MVNSKIIVIVEDEDGVSSVYKTRLAEENYTTHIVKTAKDAIETIHKVKPNLVLLDVMLPGGMNGFDVLEDMKRSPDTNAIPVIVLTNLDSERETALKIGATDYVVKANTSIEETVQKIKKYLV
jgi:DNA-binding response OmpR family regulator